MNSKSLIALTLLITLARPAAGGAAQEAGYRVGPDDVLRVSIWKQPALSGSYPVDEGGAVHLPLLGRVAVGGLTRQAIETVLAEALAAGYVRDPQVMVAVEQFRSQHIFITGEVREPGTVTLSGPMTLLEALARVGSTTEHAGRQAIIARPLSPRRDGTPATFDGSAEIVRVDLGELLRGDVSGNVVMRDGDTIFVPRAETVHVLGAVHRPGEYPIYPETRIAEVISRAGGVTERGSDNRIRVTRVVNGKPRKLKVSLHDGLRAGDIVFVLERIF